MKTNNKPEWDWKNMIASDVFYKFQLDGYPGWHKPLLEVKLEIVNGEDVSSRDMAIKFDDIARGQFWYRDVTQSGLPFVDSGERYRAIFCFQREDDYFEFLTNYALIK